MSKAAATLHSVGGLLLAIALVRLTSATSELPYWETDPAIQFVPETTITPAMSLTLDAVTWLACGIAFACMAGLKRRVSAWTVLAAMVGGAVAVGHGFGLSGVTNTQDLVRGSLWASSMIGAVTLAHLASDRVFRRLCFASLAGVAVYMSAKGSFQILVEFPRYIQHFEQNKEQILAAQGTAPGWAQALIYERRVRQPAATGWGGLSNSFGTVVAAGALAWLALTLGARKVVEKERTGLLGVIALAGLVSLAGLWWSQSRAALALAVTVAVAIPLARRLPRGVGRISIIGLCALALLGVVAQGLLGPDIGDLSLYFRAQYWQGALGVFLDNPVTGVGAGSFKDAFLLHRPPTCPEEVDSPHSVFIDWLAAIGVFALPWIGITLAALWRAGTRLVAPPEEEATDETPGKANRLALVAIALLVFAWGAWLEWPTLLPDELFVRALACGLWIGSSFVYFGLAPKLTPRLDALLWALMACLVAVHSMIEMTAVMPTTVMWGLVLVLVAGWSASAKSKALNTVSVAQIVVGLCLVVFTVVPAMRFERVFREAAERDRNCLEELLGGDSELSAHQLQQFMSMTLESLDQIDAVASYWPQSQSSRVFGYRFALVTPVLVIFEINESIQSISRDTDTESESLWLIEAHEWIEAFRESANKGIRQHPNSSSLHMWHSLTHYRFEQFDELLKDQWRESIDRDLDFSVILPTPVSSGAQIALESAEKAVALDPWGLEPAQALYRLHRDLGQTDEARRAALRLLEIDDAKHLDPLRGLSEAERAAVEAFLQETAPEAR